MTLNDTKLPEMIPQIRSSYQFPVVLKWFKVICVASAKGKRNEGGGGGGNPSKGKRNEGGGGGGNPSKGKRNEGGGKNPSKGKRNEGGGGGLGNPSPLRLLRRLV